MNDILIGKGDKEVFLLPKHANRHGMIAGATGTGKSVSLMLLAEGFSKLGVPVFLADVKGDLAGLAEAGVMNDKLKARIDKLGIAWTAGANPVVFWDSYGKLGHPVRTTISEIGPNLLARLMELNDTQSGVLEVVFQGRRRAAARLADLSRPVRPAAGGTGVLRQGQGPRQRRPRSACAGGAAPLPHFHARSVRPDPAGDRQHLPMTTPDIVAKLWNLCNVLKDDGVTYGPRCRFPRSTRSPMRSSVNTGATRSSAWSTCKTPTASR